MMTGLFWEAVFLFNCFCDNMQNGDGYLLIEFLNGLHETVDYRGDFKIRLYMNKESEDYPRTGIQMPK
jgi:hypothetical protein